MKSFAKINIFLKITGTRGNYHELNSRFVLIKNLFDEISFKSGNFEGFCIKTETEINGENIINKAYNELCKAGFSRELNEFFKNNCVILKKNIPLGGGLGGGSSNAATFLKMANKELNLKISKRNLMKIGAKIGADVSFFLSDEICANVSGIGEIIMPFDDEIPNFEILQKPVCCDTAKVYKEFRAHFFDTINLKFSAKLSRLKSSEILANFKNYMLNDLLAPAQKIYPNLKINNDEFLSGSGSSCFKVK